METVPPKYMNWTYLAAEYMLPIPLPYPTFQLNDGVWFMQIKQPNITLGILPEGGDILAAWPRVAMFIPTRQRQAHPHLADGV